MGLAQYFSARVTAEDDMDTLAERLLSASLKLQRPPDHCVVFVASPSAVTAAHNCTMKARPCCLHMSIAVRVQVALRCLSGPRCCKRPDAGDHCQRSSTSEPVAVLSGQRGYEG